MPPRKGNRTPKRQKEHFWWFDSISTLSAAIPREGYGQNGISNVLYAHLLRKNSPNQGFSAGGFLAQDQRCEDMPHVHRHTYVREATPFPVPSFAPTQMQSADNVFPQGYFFNNFNSLKMFNIHLKVVAVLATMFWTKEQSHQMKQDMFITYLYFFDFCPLNIVSMDFFGDYKHICLLSKVSRKLRFLNY